MNQKALGILNKLCPEDIQAFPATILPEPGSPYHFENHDYWVINITRLIDVIDQYASILSFHKEAPDRISDVKKMVFLNKQEFSIPFIARIKNYHSLKIVSPSLAQAFKEAKVTGVEFIEDKDYGG